MTIESILEWAAMGRHGFYVWLAYGSTAVVLIGLVLETRWSAARLWRDIEDDLAARRESGES